MKPKSEGEDMKLSDVIKEMQVDSNWGEVHLESCEKWMRLACEAMAKEIVPNEKLMDRILHNYTKPELDKKDAWNSCRDEMIKNIAEFMDEKK